MNQPTDPVADTVDNEPEWLEHVLDDFIDEIQDENSHRTTAEVRREFVAALAAQVATLTAERDHWKGVAEEQPEPCPLDHGCSLEGSPCSCWCPLHDCALDECPSYKLVAGWLAERTRERDAALRKATSAWNLADTLGFEGMTTARELARQRDQAVRERDAMRTVLEAAIAWANANQADSSQLSFQEIKGRRRDLLAAVERYQHPLITISPTDHVYLSTACLHGEHAYCAGTTRQDGNPKTPAQCKFCGAGCVCGCGHPSPAGQCDDTCTADCGRCKGIRNMGPMHVGRAWSGHDIEDQCPCPQEPCGLVDPARADPECTQHPISRGRSIRQGHKASECPSGAPAAHELTIIPRPTLDAPSLVAACCSCGYLSSPGTEATVTKDWRQHAAAKTAAAVVSGFVERARAAQERPRATGGIVEPGTWLIGEPRDVPSLKLTWGEAAAVARDGLLDMEARRTALAAREAAETVVAGPRKVFTTSSLTAGPAESDGTTGLTGALEAATEAARNAACDHPEWTPCVECRVRAAAPLIEREALLSVAKGILADAADVERQWQTGHGDAWDRGYVAGMERAAHKIANDVQRADRARAASLVVTGEGGDDA